MRLRTLSLTTLFAASVFAAAAHAHDPSLHELPAPKAKPSTCEELADTRRYAAELADKAMKMKCEAEAKESKNKVANAEADDKGD
jgi:hypothetical protein